MKNREEAVRIIEILKKTYPEATCSLDFKTPFQMMIAVMLSAQCTDERVNKTTPELFERYGTAEKMAKAKLEDVEKIIHPCGFYKNKAKNAIEAAKTILEKYNGEVPSDINELVTIPRSWKKKCKCNYVRSFQ